MMTWIETSYCLVVAHLMIDQTAVGSSSRILISTDLRSVVISDHYLLVITTWFIRTLVSRIGRPGCLELRDDGLVGSNPLNGLNRLQRLLNLLAEKGGCGVEELATAAGWPVDRTRSIVEFLAEHGTVYYRATENMVRIDPLLRRLIVEED